MTTTVLATGFMAVIAYIDVLMRPPAKGLVPQQISLDGWIAADPRPGMPRG